MSDDDASSDAARSKLLASLKARVDAVKISGLSRTRDDYVQRVGKELFSAKTFEELYIAALNTRYRLIELGIYKDLHVHIDVSKGKNATPHGYEVLFDGVELSKVTGTAGTEIGQNEGSLTVELATPNLFGRGERVSLEGRYGNSKTSDVSLKFSKPFLHTEIGDHKPEVSVGFFRHTNDVPYSGYRSQNIGVLADISFLLPLRISHSIQYEASIREISIIGKSTPFQIREHCGPKMASVIRLVSSIDERDSKIFPNKGYYIQLTNEYSGLGGNIGYLLHRVHSEINFPLFSGISAQLSSRAGVIRRNQMWPDVPISSLFTLGGPLSIRGFKHGGVGSNVDGYATGAQAFWAVGLHLWAPLPFNKYFGGFGNLFRTHAFWNFGDCGSFSLENMRSAVGLGLALRLGDRARIEFNYCWPLRKYNDDRIQKGFQFGIGYEFL